MVYQKFQYDTKPNTNIDFNTNIFGIIRTSLYFNNIQVYIYLTVYLHYMYKTFVANLPGTLLQGNFLFMTVYPFKKSIDIQVCQKAVLHVCKMCI